MQLALWRARYPLIGNVAEALGLDHISATPWFWAIGIALVVVISTSSARRAASLLHGGSPSRQRIRLTATWPAVTLETAIVAVRRHGYSVTQTEAGFLAVKGRMGRWGSVVFHASIAIVIAGVFLSSATRFTGFVELAPGQTFREGADQYMAERRGPLGKEDAGLSLAVRDVSLTFWPDDTVKGVQASVTAWDAKGIPVERTIGRNEAFSGLGSTILLGSRLGPSALLRFTPLGNGEPQQGYVNFPSDSPNAQNRFDVPGSGNLTAEVLLEGNWRAALANPDASIPPELRLVFWNGGEIVDQVILQAGQSVTLPSGDLTFVGIEPWALFMVGRDGGFWLLLVGGAAALIGLAMALFITPRWIEAFATPEGLQVVESVSRPSASFRREVAGIGAQLGRNDVV